MKPSRLKPGVRPPFVRGCAMRMRYPLVLFAVVLALLGAAGAQPGPPRGERVEKNAVYGMYSGLALLMDIHYPETPNGVGVIYVDGSAWHARLSYDAMALKDRPGLLVATRPLVQAGYTVF